MLLLLHKIDFYSCILFVLMLKKKNIWIIELLRNYLTPVYEDRLVSYSDRSGDGKTDIYICMEYNVFDGDPAHYREPAQFRNAVI